MVHPRHTADHSPPTPSSGGKPAWRGEPSYVWRAGQERRLQIILEESGERARGRVLDNGCGVGVYLARLADSAELAVGIEYDPERARLSSAHSATAIAAGENLPFPAGAYDLVLSHEVLEHVSNDRRALEEIVRVLRPGGRAVIFVPNRGYPFETHGVFWRGAYRFGDIPFVNYLPRRWRDRLAPHVRSYTGSDLEKMLADLPVRVPSRGVIFGAYDNLIARWGWGGRLLRSILRAAEKTPLRAFGLSHVWVIEKTLNQETPGVFETPGV